MDRQYIHDHQVIERYLQGRLTPAEEEAFEELYLADRELVDELELTERLAGAMNDLVRAGLRPVVPRRRPRGWLSVASSPQYAAAASLLLAASLIFSAVLYRENAELRDARPLVAENVLTRRVPIISVRGAEDVNRVAAPAEEEWVVLLLDPGLDYTLYRATVVRRGEAAAETVWELSGVVPGFDGRLDVGLPGHLLTPGDYEVELAGRMGEWPADRDWDEITRMTFSVTAGQ
jgi:hypothetical protein